MPQSPFAKKLFTAAVEGTPDKSVFQPFKVNRNTIFRGLRTWIIFYNDPALTNIAFQLYTNNYIASTNQNLPGHLIAESNALTKAEIITLMNGIKGMGFTFPDVSMRIGDRYHLIPKTNGYTGTNATHIGWKKAFPFPVYRTGVDSSFTKLGVSPYDLAFVGADL